MGSGRFTHASIAEADPVRGEARLGIVAHYSIGVGFAALLLRGGPSGPSARRWVPRWPWAWAPPTAPWLVMQPAFGLGVAAAKTRSHGVARLRSVRTHATYGLGLYLTGRALKAAGVSWSGA